MWLVVALTGIGLMTVGIALRDHALILAAGCSTWAFLILKAGLDRCRQRKLEALLRQRGSQWGGHAPCATERTAGVDEEVTVSTSRETGRRSIASNRRARRDYTILKTYEAGIVLEGTEVKSLRAGHASLVGAFVQEHDGELMIHGLHIPEHGYGRRTARALDRPRRTRKLLMHRSEIDKIIGTLGEAGVTLVPLSLYFSNGWAKVEIALARGRRSFDKRQAIAQRDADREIARELSDRLRGRRRQTRGPG
jgi:SsrA-binding protein